ncbi:unnamed protein product [Lepeophtheirus salmonis]|uniref:(salmon louse) hypothetical protein n=1 Tax=Lepeophtheirus salmonis TaxID=72036 RepID=A0A7R8CXW8_LEPSM|nr:unnamed protein product [Lepeophtheirus salmonis]CAF2965643.1 unnamed protein product [Lepeophtheirus salmonis]
MDNQLKFLYIMTEEMFLVSTIWWKQVVPYNFTPRMCMVENNLAGCGQTGFLSKYVTRKYQGIVQGERFGKGLVIKRVTMERHPEFVMKGGLDKKYLLRFKVNSSSGGRICLQIHSCLNNLNQNVC